jgi:electron transport complex protein RnfC
MNIFTFRGGVHPPEEKELCKDVPIRKAEIPETLVIPLVQHIGAPCEPAVSQGDNVKAGQVLGKARGFVSVPVHAPVSGKVKRIEKALHPLGQNVLSVVVQNDGEDETAYMDPMGSDIEGLNPKDILGRVLEGGIAGMGGATFPAHVKLSPPKGKPIDTLIINGCECEPYLAADYRLMLERTGDLILGARMIGKVLGVEKIIFAVETNKQDAAGAIGDALNGNTDCMLTQTKYPQGAEKMLIKAVLGREVPSGGLPMDVGVVVSNVGTAVAICEAVRDGKPLFERVVSVTGKGVKSPANFMAKIGTPISALIEQAGGTDGQPGKVIMGGPMMGIAQSSLDVPVIKGMSGIVVLLREPYMVQTHGPCIKCSFCVQACPTSLLPSTLSIIAEAEKWNLAEKYGVNDCIECGSCAYVCPSKRPIVQLIKTAKQKLREIKAREKK